MRTKRVYLDTSVFMAEFYKKDPRHASLTEFFNKARKIQDIELCSSKWALTELTNRLTKDKVDESIIFKFQNELLNKNKIRNIKFRFLNVSPNKDYNFDHFFHDLTKDLIKYKTGNDRPGLGDIIHIRIMKNNRVNIIISFDSDFEEIKDLTCLNPQTTKSSEAIPNH